MKITEDGVVIFKINRNLASVYEKHDNLAPADSDCCRRGMEEQTLVGCCK